MNNEDHQLEATVGPIQVVAHQARGFRTKWTLHRSGPAFYTTQSKADALFQAGRHADVAEVVATAPPLSEDQRHTIAALLRSGQQ